MKLILIAVVAVSLYWMYRNRPVRGVPSIEANVLLQRLRNEAGSLQIVDVRDQNDYYADHIEGSVNISLGRLPFIKKHGLNKEAETIIIADVNRESRQAARILRKSGFTRLVYLEHGIQSLKRAERGVRAAQAHVCCCSRGC
ncbi:molybdopterin biosynthesis protein MoeB [Paenibacillus konkukensis]|uniref:Molybdopterin biosynthesis protein MoeB n=1 Tax=Paenibacillus konkukensis TaxID=2020716 RepID=A0ABY4RNB9_9BACL|nr:rhodanese-like domain-containing protein [Paenibacillus konkukensis]UQZ83567.1 molybdopterin biosynthesis protein MoeB [Paenibacillus konkukensis]